MGRRANTLATHCLLQHMLYAPPPTNPTGESKEPTALQQREDPTGRRNSARFSMNVALTVAAASAQAVMRVRMLSRVYVWPEATTEVAQFYHTALSAFFAARAAGYSYVMAAKSIRTGTSALARKRKGAGGAVVGAGSPRARSPTGARRSAHYLFACSFLTHPSTTLLPQPSPSPGRPPQTRIEYLWQRLRDVVKEARQSKAHFRLRKRQCSEYLQRFFAKKLRARSTSVPVRLDRVHQSLAVLVVVATSLTTDLMPLPILVASDGDES